VTVDIEVVDLVDRLIALRHDALIGFDVDGVLAPIVGHAEQSCLSPGVRESLSALARYSTVAILSGRSLDSLERRFAFASELHVIGSHGLEVRGSTAVELGDDERYTYEQLEILGTKTVEAAGEGAWLEYKPASVVVHTREADPAMSARAVAALDNLANMLDGAQVKRGHEVVELLARSASKGDALVALAARLGLAPLVYFGDDLTDEDAFTLMGDDDVSVKVGPGPTAARFRIAGTTEVANVLTGLQRG